MPKQLNLLGPSVIPLPIEITPFSLRTDPLLACQTIPLPLLQSIAIHTEVASPVTSLDLVFAKEFADDHMPAAVRLLAILD